MRMDTKKAEDYCKRTGQMDKLDMTTYAPREEPKKIYPDGIEIKEEKQTKYGNKPTWVNDHLFSSKKEAQYYIDLLLQERCGLVKDIQLQPVYMLQEAFKKNGKSYRAITYIADFEFDQKAVRGSHWVTRIVDTKGVKTEAFKIKVKLFELRYPDKTIIVI